MGRSARHRAGFPQAARHSRDAAAARRQLDDLTVAEVFDKFLDWCQKHREQRTYEGYLEYTQQFLDHLKDRATQPSASLRPFHVVEWVDSHDGWNDTTRRNAITHVQRPFNWAAKMAYIDTNPVRYVDKPPARRRENPILPADFTAIMAKVKDEPFRDLLSFAWETGCRPQEARHIELRHVEMGSRRIVIPPKEAKGRKHYRIIRLTDAALEIVRRHMDGRKDGKLFLNTNGSPWKVHAICNRFSRLKQKLGKSFSAYSLRHGFAQRMLENGIDHLTVAELMGHANGQMLATVYQHLNQAKDHLQEALKKSSHA